MTVLEHKNTIVGIAAKKKKKQKQVDPSNIKYYGKIYELKFSKGSFDSVVKL